MIDTIVFSGPSLSPEEAKKYYPSACFHKPIKCGDIIKCLRLKPKRIAIIDGYFEQTGAVWHKEILFAINQGIEVFGSSSMGALRASELKDYGMVGFGKIYQEFADGNPDDDDVALVHEADFNQRIVPMCNITATLNAAVSNNILSATTSEEIKKRLKNLPYYERAFFEHINDTDVLAWCKANFVDQKKQDAIGLLQHLTKTPPKKMDGHKFKSTVFFSKIYREMILTPFDDIYPWLPNDERILISLKPSSYFLALTRYAKLLHIAHDLNLKVTKQQHSESWVNYLSIYDKATDFHSLTLYKLSAVILDQLASHMNGLEIYIHPAKLQKFANQFRIQTHLTSIETTHKWLKKTQLNDPTGFSHFINHISLVHYIVDEHNAHLLGSPMTHSDTNWLKLADSKLTAVLELQKEA